MRPLSHIIKQYNITNFKAFSSQTVIPIRPVTLIYGPNSSGKSSVFQSLLMLKQSIEDTKRYGSALSPKGKLTDLGSYAEFIHGHDPKKSFSFVAHLARPKHLGDILPADAHYEMHDYSPFFEKLNEDFPYKTLGIGINFDFDRKKGILPTQIDLFLGAEPGPIITYISDGHPFFKISQVNLQHPYWHSYCQSLLESCDFSENQFYGGFSPDELLATINSLLVSNPCCEKIDSLKQLNQLIEKPDFHLQLTKKVKPLSLNPDILKIAEKIKDYHQKCAPNNFEQIVIKRFNRVFLQKLFSKVTPAIEVFNEAEWITAPIDNINTENNQYSLLLNKFLPEETGFLPQEMVYQHWNASSHQADNPSIFILIASYLLDKFLNDIFYIGPLRHYPERHYSFAGLHTEQVGAKGEFIYDLLIQNPKLVKKLNRTFSAMKLPYELKVIPLSKKTADIHDLYAIRLYSASSRVHVSLTDVGFGVSQVLPIIAQCAVSEARTLLIEQPELHLHPAQQAELGDIFIQSALVNKNTLLIETHSEHIILRIMRRMRETYEGKLSKGDIPIHPEDVSIIYVEPDINGSVVREMPLNARGELVKAWPGGFFEEGLREVLP
ncbi:MAG TPA: AAA family ATPase [Syntrophorhabdus sp.]|nr:AAA family ATPase [Syntrophorhabdus sp.]